MARAAQLEWRCQFSPAVHSDRDATILPGDPADDQARYIEAA